MFLLCGVMAAVIGLLLGPGEAIGQRPYSSQEFDYRIGISDTLFSPHSSVEYGLKRVDGPVPGREGLSSVDLYSYELVVQAGEDTTRLIRSVRRWKYDAVDWGQGRPIVVTVGLLDLLLYDHDLLLVAAHEDRLPQKCLLHIFTKLAEQGRILDKKKDSLLPGDLAMVAVKVGESDGNESVTRELQEVDFLISDRLFFILCNQNAIEELPEIITSQPNHYTVGPLGPQRRQFQTVEARTTEYLMKDWEDIRHLSTKVQFDSVASKVEECWKQLKGKKAISAEEAQTINERWQNGKEEMNKRWFQELFDREERFHNSFRNYVEKAQQISNTENRIQLAGQRISQLEQWISFANQRIEQIEETKGKTTENLRSRLANIPMTIVAVGGIKVPPEEETSLLRTSTTNRMIMEAVKTVIGDRVLTYTEVQNNEIVRNAIAKKTEGNALVADTYYTDLYKYIEYHTYHFQIHRIDVYPFNRGKPKLYTYAEDVPEPKRRQYEEQAKVSFDPSEVTLSKTEKDFWVSQNQMMRNANSRVEGELRDFRMKYEAEMDTLNRRMLAVREEIENSERDLEAAREEVKQLGEEVKVSKRDTMRRLSKQYEEDKKSYKRFYAERESYVNRFEQRGAPASDKNEIQHVREMARNTFNVINELRKGYVEIFVLVEFPGLKDDPATMIVRREIKSYKPRISAFRILYLTLVTPEEGGNASPLLNIAYRLIWSSQERLDLTRADERILIVNEGERRYEWRLISDEYTNPYDAKSIEDEEWLPEGWRLPTYSELMSLFSYIREEDQDGEVFQKRGWPYGPYLLSEEIGGSKYLAYRFTSGIPDTLELGDDVYTLRVKPPNEED